MTCSSSRRIAHSSSWIYKQIYLFTKSKNVYFQNKAKQDFPLLLDCECSFIWKIKKQESRTFKTPNILIFQTRKSQCSIFSVSHQVALFIQTSPTCVMQILSLKHHKGKLHKEWFETLSEEVTHRMV